MGSPAIGETAVWTAIKTFVVAALASAAAEGKVPAAVDASKVYRKGQNASEIRGTPASVRIWSDDGVGAVGASWPITRTKVAERWRLHVVAAAPGELYSGSVLDTPFSYTAQPGDSVGAVRNGLLADLPGTVNAVASGAADIDITAQAVGVPLALEVEPAELVTATKTRKTGRQTARCAGEMTVQFEVVVELPRDDPESVPSALVYLDAILGKLAHGRVGPAGDLHNAGVAFMRYAMAPENLTGLDRAAVRGRARADIVFTIDVSDTVEFDLLAAVAPPTLNMEV